MSFRTRSVEMCWREGESLTLCMFEKISLRPIAQPYKLIRNDMFF